MMMMVPALLRRRTAAPHPIQTAMRHISGGAGRGDLFSSRDVAHPHRVLGIHRGLTDSSQSTHAQSGQLRNRKRIMHQMHHSVRSGSERLQPRIAAWSYLMPSLSRAVEHAIPNDLWHNLRNTDVELSEKELDVLRAGHRLIHFELHQRLPLLEDSLADAQLRHLLQWPTLFHRAWMLPPREAVEAMRDALQEDLPSSSSSSSSVATISSAIIPCPSSSSLHRHHHLARSIMSTCTLTQQTSSTANHDGDDVFAARVAQLSRQVVRCVAYHRRAQHDAVAPSRQRHLRVLDEQWRQAVEWMDVCSSSSP